MSRRPLAVVTGASRGIGKAIACSLLRLDYEVILACRILSEGLAAKDILVAEVGCEENLCAVSECDVSRTDSIDLFLDSLAPRVNVLVNNAGINSNHPEADSGISERILRTNFFGPSYLTQGLLDRGLFDASPDSSLVVVTVSSSHGMCSRMDRSLKRSVLDSSSLDEIRSFAETFLSDVSSTNLSRYGHFYTRLPYAISKLCLNSMTCTLARNFPSVWFGAVYPGWCRTEMGTQRAPRSAEKGAETVVWAICGEHEELVSGRAWMDCREARF